MCQVLGKCFITSSLSSFLEQVESSLDSVSDITRLRVTPAWPSSRSESGLTLAEASPSPEPKCLTVT